MNDTVQSEETLTERLERELGALKGTALVEEMRLYLTRLMETEDPGWVDLVVWRLTEEGVHLPEGIQRLAANAALRRLLGEGRRGSNPTKVWKEHAKAIAHANSAFLQGLNGMGAEEADLRAVVSVESELGHAPKASSLSQERPSVTKQNPVLGVLASVGRALEENYPKQAAALAEHTALLAAKAKDAKKKQKPNKLGTRR